MRAGKELSEKENSTQQKIKLIAKATMVTAVVPSTADVSSSSSASSTVFPSSTVGAVVGRSVTVTPRQQPSMSPLRVGQHNPCRPHALHCGCRAQCAGDIDGLNVGDPVGEYVGDSVGKDVGEGVRQAS